MEYLIFVSDGKVTIASELNSEYWIKIWRPSITHVIPPTLGPKFAFWWLFHYLKIFRNRDYAVLLIGVGNLIIHRSCIIPAYFRWPFMNFNDCQISSTWTHPDFRGKGLATIGLKKAIQIYAKPNRCFWYVSRKNNPASISVCKKAGFSLFGTGRRIKRMGTKLLGMLVIDDEIDCALDCSKYISINCIGKND
ncbi:MAG: GNAT family N-acetyltransferase [Desulfitobacteriaceae bacterium]|nr:GNAT family N-acetyltransferase [Desulfitobacteriaceae bacterium]